MRPSSFAEELDPEFPALQTTCSEHLPCRGNGLHPTGERRRPADVEASPSVTLWLLSHRSSLQGEFAVATSMSWQSEGPSHAMPLLKQSVRDPRVDAEMCFAVAVAVDATSAAAKRTSTPLPLPSCESLTRPWCPISCCRDIDLGIKWEK
jgi:hypothetical protein